MTSIPPGVGEMSRAEAALAYAEAGMCVIPCKPGTRNPGSLLGKNWPELSSRERGKIEAWWEKWPDAEIAGHMGRSGLIAFDLDIETLAEVPEPYLSSLRKAKYQQTRPGTDRGHYIFRISKADSFSNSPGGFGGFGEVRGSNGVIMLQPSTHTKDGRYCWPKPGKIPLLPDELRELLREAATHEPAMPNAELEAFLDGHTDDDRPNALAGAVGVFERDIEAGRSRHGASLDALCMAFRESVAGCYPARQAYEELEAAFTEAFEAPPPGTPARRSRPARGEFAANAAWAAAQALVSDPDETLAKLDRDSTKSRPRRFRLLSREDLRALLPPTWLIADHIVAGGLSVLYGPSGHGKTFLALDQALSVAAGISWHRNRTAEPRAVVFVAPEGAGGLNRRVSAWEAAHPRADTSRFYVVDDAVNLFSRDPRKPAEEDVSMFCAAVAHLDPALIVFDTVARSMAGGDENAAKDMGLVVAAADRIRKTTGAAVVLVHHTGKDNKDERGSSALRAAADTMVKAYQALGDLRVTCEKQKDSEPFLDLRFYLVPYADSIALEAARPDPAADDLRQAIIDALTEASGPLSKNEIRDQVHRHKTTVSPAIDRLLAEPGSPIRTVPGARSKSPKYELHQPQEAGP